MAAAHQTQLAISSVCVEGLLRVAAERLGPTNSEELQTDLAAFEKWQCFNTRRMPFRLFDFIDEHTCTIPVEMDWG